MELYWLQLIHLLSAMVWVGGLLFLALVVTPVMRHRLSPQQRTELFSAIGIRFRPYAWIALILLLVTGLRRAALFFGGFGELFEAFGSTTYGQILQAKLLLVVVIILMQLLHDFYLGPRLRQMANEQSPGLARARAATIGIAMGSLLLTLVVVGLAVRLRFA